MKLTVLVENHTIIDAYYLAEPAFCLYIEDGKQKILFDVGYSDVFIKNAVKMGIQLAEITDIVISHGHNDHTGGLPYFLEAFPHTHPNLYAHPMAFEKKRDDEANDIGSALTCETLKKHFRLHLSEQPVQVSKHLTFMGAIPRVHSFENTNSIGQYCPKDDCWEPDFLQDDSALVFCNDKEMSVILGCSHSGVCNILTACYARYPNKTLTNVLGGMHLLEQSNTTAKTISWLQKQQIAGLYPCHCVSLDVCIRLAKNLPVQELGVGMQLEWD